MDVFFWQFKDLLAKVTAGAYKHSCKPCTTSMYDHDAEHAVHPVPYSDTTTEMQSGQFSLPSHQYRYATTPQRAYTTVPSWGAMQGSLADQKLNVSDLKNWNSHCIYIPELSLLTLYCKAIFISALLCQQHLLPFINEVFSHCIIFIHNCIHELLKTRDGVKQCQTCLIQCIFPQLSLIFQKS